jgi:RNA polymerase sigma factor (TIGR02999 family)
MLPPDSAGHHRRQKAGLDAMMPVIYGELQRMARSYFHLEREGHTLQPTALVHEAYLRLHGQKGVDWSNRPQFLGIAARTMRRVLVDYWSRSHAQKRLEGGQRVPLEDAFRITGGPSVDFIDLDRALVALAAADPQQAEIVELRFFGGLTIDEAAEVLGLSTATVEREWSTARLWLSRHLAGAPPL